MDASTALQSNAMLSNNFIAAMTPEELQAGEAHHSASQASRRLVMAAALTKSSDELSKVWQENPEEYIQTLKAAIEAYDANANLAELLQSCVARLSSVVDQQEGIEELLERAMDIVRTAQES